MSGSIRDDPFNIVDIPPEEAVDDYLQSMQGDNAQGTIDSHSSRLSFFIKFCDEKGIDSIADLHPKHIQRYQNWRLELYDLNTITLKTNMDTLHVFIRWCANTRYCHPNLEDAVPSVETTRGDTIDEAWLEPEVMLHSLD